MTKKRPFYNRLVGWLASERTFRVIVGIFVFQAVWIALSGRYPLAFDEEFHVGIIRLYAHHWLPFWGAQPANADSFGAVARDGSYLYHWLLSFPYRLIALITSNQTAQVLALRALNIGLFVAGLVVYRRLMLKVTSSRAVVHACLLLLILLPVVPLLGAQINYDNLFIPAIGLILLLAVDFSQELQQTKRLNMRTLLSVLSLCLLASLIKYAFLPIFLAIAACFLLQALRTYPGVRRLLVSIGFGLTLMTKRLRWLLLILFFVSIGLFVERYGVNIVRYHKPVPDCAEVIGEKRCAAYGPWQRDHLLAINKTDDTHANPVRFGFEWLYGMWFRLFFAVDGKGSNYETRGPLLLPAISAIFFVLSGIAAMLVAVKRGLYSQLSWFHYLLISVVGFYLLVLFLDGYEAYHRTGHAVAINGRYLLPVLPLILLAFALSFKALITNRRVRTTLLLVAVLSLVWGGGLLTYILRSSDYWYWDNAAVRSINRSVRHVVGPLVPGYKQPLLFFKST